MSAIDSVPQRCGETGALQIETGRERQGQDREKDREQRTRTQLEKAH